MMQNGMKILNKCKELKTKCNIFKNGKTEEVYYLLPILNFNKKSIYINELKIIIITNETQLSKGLKNRLIMYVMTDYFSIPINQPEYNHLKDNDQIRSLSY